MVFRQKSRARWRCGRSRALEQELEGFGGQSGICRHHYVDDLAEARLWRDALAPTSFFFFDLVCVLYPVFRSTYSLGARGVARAGGVRDPVRSVLIKYVVGETRA